MVAMPNHSVLAVLLSDAGIERDTESTAQTSVAALAEREVSEERDGECDLGALDLPEDYEEYHERGFYHPYD